MKTDKQNITDLDKRPVMPLRKTMTVSYNINKEEIIIISINNKKIFKKLASV